MLSDTGKTQTVSDNKCGSLAKMLPGCVYLCIYSYCINDIYTFLEPT